MVTATSFLTSTTNCQPVKGEAIRVKNWLKLFFCLAQSLIGGRDKCFEMTHDSGVGLERR